MRRIYSYIIPVMRVLAAVAVAVAVVSCRSETPEIPAAPDDEEGSLYLSFTIATRMQDRNTRADISYDQEGTAAENFINLDDITYLFFDGEGRYLYNVTPLTNTLAKDGSGYAVYEVTAKLYDSYFTSNIDSRIDLYILVLANYSDWGISIPAAERGVTTLKEFFKSNDLLPTLQDRQPSTYQLLKADKADAWQRSPMAGLQKVTLEGTKLAQSSKADPYSLPNNINMLRALAKIEIIDKINVPDGDVWNETEDNTGAMGALRIHKAELLGVVDRGSLLPGYDQWVNINGEETQQVSQPSVPKSAKYIKPLLFDKENTSGVIPLGRNIEFEEDNAARQAREDKCPVFSAYVFEYSKLLEEDPGYQPYVRLTTRGGKSEDADGKTESYESTIFPMRLAEYTDGETSPEKNIGALLRNHIYRFEIGGIAQAIEVKWTVCDMNAASSNITFK